MSDALVCESIDASLKDLRQRYRSPGAETNAQENPPPSKSTIRKLTTTLVALFGVSMTGLLVREVMLLLNKPKSSGATSQVRPQPLAEADSSSAAGTDPVDPAPLAFTGSQQPDSNPASAVSPAPADPAPRNNWSGASPGANRRTVPARTTIATASEVPKRRLGRPNGPTRSGQTGTTKGSSRRPSTAVVRPQPLPDAQQRTNPRLLQDGARPQASTPSSQPIQHAEAAGRSSATIPTDSVLIPKQPQAEGDQAAEAHLLAN